jgi:uncharacterized protein with PQ loop repeat
MIKDEFMRHKTFLAVLATIIGVLSYRSIILSVYKTKDTKDFPYEALFLTIISNVLWVLCGIVNKSKSMIVMSVIDVLIFSFILIVKMLYPKRGA